MFGTRNSQIEEGYPCYFVLKFVVENITVLVAYPTMSERTVHMGSVFLKTLPFHIKGGCTFALLLCGLAVTVIQAI